jgi:hypothetical protein
LLQSFGERQLGAYIPRIDVRTTLTGFSSLISITNRFPEKAAARAKALRDKDDDFGSRSPPKRACPVTRLRLPFAWSCRSPIAGLTDEVLLVFPTIFEGKNPFDAIFISLAKIPFIIEASLFALGYQGNGQLGKVSTFSGGVTSSYVIEK